MGATRAATADTHDRDTQRFATIQAAVERHLREPGSDRPLVPYPEQRAGARALLRGSIVQMATGEGKTITAAFAATVWAADGPVHIATANGYLAERDAGWLQPVYADLELSVGVVTAGQSAGERREQYRRDIVYSTLSEFGFDLLRDQMVTRLSDRVLARGLGALIVDEADLLLIDEARTPLIIARPTSPDEHADLPVLSSLVEQLVAEQADRIAAKLETARGLRPRSFEAAVVAAQLRRGGPRDPAVAAGFAARPVLLRAAERVERELRGADRWMLDDGLLFAVDERARTAYLTADGQAWLEQRGSQSLPADIFREHHYAALHNLILAHALFQRDRDYLIRDGRVVLIEQATGRAAESHRYLRGLHAAIEAKELGAVLDESDTAAQISIGALVRRYQRRAGMTGTALDAADEFRRLYDMAVEVIPRHRPDQRVDWPPRLYRTAAEVDAVVLDDLVAAHALGVPVLVGTADIARSERLSAYLAAAGLPHVVLNARDTAREAAIIARAGTESAITIATAMAGRGTDIRLQPGLPDLLLNRAASVIRQRAQQGPLRVVCASAPSARRLRQALEHDLTIKQGSGRSAHTLTVTAHAGSVTPAPVSPAEPPTLVVTLGLTVIATEPQANRRLDDQLRGRAGRQGDEGATRLYASLDDETIRFYGDARMRARTLRALRDHPFLEGRAAARVIDDAQERAVRLHAGQRHQLFALDEVVEAQRRAFARAYDAVLTHPAVAEVVRGLLPAVAAGEAALRPSDPDVQPRWLEELCDRYGLAPASLANVRRAGSALDGTFQEAFLAALQDRLARVEQEWGARWSEVSRTVMLRIATVQWAAHIDALDEVQQQAPALFAFLTAPVEISYAREANRRFAGFNATVQMEAVAALLTLPLPYERAVSRSIGGLSDAVLALPALDRTSLADGAPAKPVQ